MTIKRAHLLFSVIMAAVLLPGCKETAEELRNRAELTCLKIANTRKMDSLERTNLIVNFGITDAGRVSLIQDIIEIGYDLGTASVESCAGMLVEGVSEK